MLESNDNKEKKSKIRFSKKGQQREERPLKRVINSNCLRTLSGYTHLVTRGDMPLSSEAICGRIDEEA